MVGTNSTLVVQDGPTRESMPADFSFWNDLISIKKGWLS